MHNNDIVHRDLKCKNIVFDRPGKKGVLKIIDFGLSEHIKPWNADKEDTKFNGTIPYMAAEIMGKRNKGDLFKSI